MVITDSTINASVWDAIKDKIVAAAPYVTNSKTLATLAVSIKAVYNDEKDKPPIIVINPVVKDENDFKFSSTEGKKLINIAVDCYAENTRQVDQLIDAVETALKVDDISGIQLIGISTQNAFNLSNLSKIYMKSGIFTYDRE